MTDRFSLGRVLTDTGSALAKRWPLLLLTIAAVQVGLPLSFELAGGVTAVLPTAPPAVLGLVSQLILLAVDALAAGLLIHISLNPRSTMRDAVAAAPGGALKAFLSLYAITLIARSATLVSVPIVAELRRRVMSGEATVGELIGPLSFINSGASLVGVILSILLVAAKPAAVDEGLGPIAAIRRNFELTRRRRWLMTGLVFGSGFVVGMGQFAVILMKPAMTDRWGEMGGRLFGYAAAPVVALSIVFLTCVYRELRRLAGPDERETARVFD